MTLDGRGYRLEEGGESISGVNFRMYRNRQSAGIRRSTLWRKPVPLCSYCHQILGTLQQFSFVFGEKVGKEKQGRTAVVSHWTRLIVLSWETRDYWNLGDLVETSRIKILRKWLALSLYLQMKQIRYYDQKKTIYICHQVWLYSLGEEYISVSIKSQFRTLTWKETYFCKIIRENRMF